MNRQRAPPRAYHPNVPKTWAVQPGAAVNIVLKADQPTGRTVAGTVQDVLTRGNHPRGIKVRLTDGRVGRVQSMGAGGGAGPSGSASAGDPGGVVEGMRVLDLESGGGAGVGAGRLTREDRDEVAGGSSAAAGAMPAQQIGLEAYIKEAKKPKSKRKGKGSGSAAAVSDQATEEQTLQSSAVDQAAEGEPIPSQAPGAPPTEMATCPVCDDFEGDEAAVSHHVASHFDTAS